jgi:hypothetical protein
VTSRSKLALVFVLAIAAIVVWRLRSRSDGATTSSSGKPSSSALTEPRSAATAMPPPSASVGERAPTTGTRVLAAKWGGGLGELGRERPQEGNAEGPMSFAPAGSGYVVIDQVNGRLARYDERGRFERAQDIAKTVQDVAVTRDGSTVLLDRLGEKKLTLLDPRGKRIGELPLGQNGKIGEPGLVTGVFVDGKDVYVEKEHGVLLHVGTTDGQPPDEGKELAGRPSKDGALLLTAGLSSPREGKAYLNAVDRKSGSLRFARALSFPRPASAIVLLDSDAQGALYLGVAAGAEPPMAHVACLDASDGHVLGRIVVPLSTTPEETFRDLAVSAEGNIIFAVRTEEGIEYRAARCP